MAILHYTMKFFVVKNCLTAADGFSFSRQSPWHRFVSQLYTEGLARNKKDVIRM